MTAQTSNHLDSEYFRAYDDKYLKVWSMNNHLKDNNPQEQSAIQKFWHQVLPWISLICLGVFLAEGFLYYRYVEDTAYKVFQVIQNCGDAFLFRPSIELGDALSFMTDHPDLLSKTIGYLYGLGVFIAPLCTLTVLYRVVENMINRTFRKAQKKIGKHSAIFGWNDLTKSIVKNHGSSTQDEQEEQKLQESSWWKHLGKTQPAAHSALSVYTRESLSHQYRADMMKKMSLFIMKTD